MDVAIRRITVDDAQSVVELINSVIAEGGLTAIYPPLTVEQEAAFICGLGPRSAMFAAELDGAVLGIQTIDPYAAYTQAMDHVASMGTFVHRNFRGQGIGRKLTETTFRFAYKQGYEKVIVCVRLGNSGAQKFYRKMGFIPKMMLERQVKIEGKYDDEMLMELFVPTFEEAEAVEAIPQALPATAPTTAPAAIPAAPVTSQVIVETIPPPVKEPEPAVAEKPAPIIVAPHPAVAPAGVIAPAAVDPAVGAVTVRRAKRQDIKTLVAVMRGTIRWRQPPSEEEVLDMLFDKGYWMAMSRKGGGVTGWRAENLVMCIDDFYVYPPQYYPQIGGPLLETVEVEARALFCEVAIVFFDKQIAPEAVRFFQSQGYERQEFDQLFSIWRQVAQELLTENRFMMVKKLLEKRIMRPV